MGGEYPLGSLSMEELAGCNRAAIVVIARRPEQTDCTLTDSETQMLRSVTTAFDRTILVLATPGLRRTERRRDGLPGHRLDGHCRTGGRFCPGRRPDGEGAADGPPAVLVAVSWTDFDAANAQADSLSATVILIPSARSCAGRSVTVSAMARARSAA